MSEETYREVPGAPPRREVSTSDAYGIVTCKPYPKPDTYPGMLPRPPLSGADALAEIVAGCRRPENGRLADSAGMFRVAVSPNTRDRIMGWMNEVGRSETRVSTPADWPEHDSKRAFAIYDKAHLFAVRGMPDNAVSFANRRIPGEAA